MISVCIPVKNRAKQLKRCVKRLESLKGDIEIVVADFRSDDTDYGTWFKHKLVVLDDDFFSIGRGKNAAAEAASGDILFFLDADCIVPQHLIDRINEIVPAGGVYAPIMNMQAEKGGTRGEWAIHSFGQVAVRRDMYEAGENWPEWNSYGGEDNIFYGQFKLIATREKVEGFVHQWHPHELRTKHYRDGEYTDLNKIKPLYKARKDIGKTIIGGTK